MKSALLIVPLVILLSFAFGCQDKAAMAELEAFRARAAVEEQNKEIVRYALELYDEKKFVERDKLFSPHVLYHAPGGKEYSLKGYREHFGNHFYTAFPDLRHTIEDIIADGDKVVLRLSDYGTHEGEFMGIPPTGQEIQWPVTSVYRLSDGIVQEIWIEFDILSLIQQLGMELKPKEAEQGEHAGEKHELREHSEEEEESGPQISKEGTYDDIRKGVRLILSFDTESSSFIGTVENVTEKMISRVRIEVHLSNGTELGPTEPFDLAPGKKEDVILSAAGQPFIWWRAHAESGASEY